MPKTSHALATLLLSSLAVGQCITGLGTAIVVAQDSITGPNAIGFAFPFAGGTYTDIHISDHGICYLTNGGVPATPVATPLVYTPVAASLVANGPVICPIWGDSIPGASGTFFIDATPTVCTISWISIQSFGFAAPLFSFQLKLNSTGVIEFVYGPNVTNNSTFGGVSDNGIVGVSEGTPAALPASVDFSTSPSSAGNTIFEEFLVANTFDMQGDSVLLIPGPLGGWQVVHMPNGAGCATATAYGAGCDNLVLTSNLPRVGTNWDLTTGGFNPVSAIGLTYFSFGQQVPAIPLPTLGFPAPGCDVNIDLTLIIASLTGLVTPNFTTLVTVPIPGGAAFIGVPLNAQSIGFTNTNAAGFATSNGMGGVIGN